MVEVSTEHCTDDSASTPRAHGEAISYVDGIMCANFVESKAALRPNRVRDDAHLMRGEMDA